MQRGVRRAIEKKKYKCLGEISQLCEALFEIEENTLEAANQATDRNLKSSASIVKGI